MDQFKQRWTLVAVTMLLVTPFPGHVTGDEEEESPLQECLKDADYDDMLEVVQHGLTPIKTPNHVVIVGAGIAGLTAAKLLRDAGHQVTILEADNRVGGRVETYRDEEHGWYVEYGAMRIPLSHRILRRFINQLGVKLNDFIMYDPDGFYLVNGLKKPVRAREVKAKPDILGYKVQENERGITAGKLFSKALDKVRQEVKAHGCIAALKRFDKYSVKSYLKEVADLSDEAIRMIGDVLNQQSLMFTALIEMVYEQSDIGDNITYSEVTGGTELLTRAFHDYLKKVVVPIHLSSTVKLIRRSGEGVIVAYQKDDRTDLTSVAADFVLVTATARATRFIDFDPPLSVKKMDTMRGVHYESSTKVVLICSEKFWEKDSIRGGKSITDGPSRFIYYPSHSFPTNKTVGVLLASYTWSDDSLLFLGASDEDLKDLVLKDLEKIHQRDVSSLCTEVKVKRWSSDPYSLGAFALFTPYQHLEYARELFRSEGRIHFAGEHTAFPHAWIETSMKSAIRAAQNITNAVLLDSDMGQVRQEL